MLSLDNVVKKGQENRLVHVPWFSDLEMWIRKILCIDILREVCCDPFIRGLLSSALRGDIYGRC